MYGVCPELVTVIVKVTCSPGVAVVTLAVVDTARPGISTLTVLAHWAATPQVLPGAGEVTEVVSRWLPASGSATVTLYVMIAVAPTARSPVQVSVGSRKVTAPLVDRAPPE